MGLFCGTDEEIASYEMTIFCEMWMIVVENSCAKHVVFLCWCFQILFQCETCENEFAAPWNLEKHKGKNMKQETQVFNCEKCKNEFPSIGSLKKHLRRIHEVKENSCCFSQSMFSNSVSMWNMWKRICSSLISWEAQRKEDEAGNSSF